MRPTGWKPALLLQFVLTAPLWSAEPLHEQIDRLIEAKAQGQPLSAAADDAAFLRRLYLDLAGRIPTTAELREFLAEAAADKRAKWIDRLLAGPDYPARMSDLFHVMLMERLGEHPEWTKYLRESFAANKPWDQMAREILRGRPSDEATVGAAFFYSKRLENIGQNPVDYPALTRDVGRLFLGLDLQCAQCHDHIFIDDYTQQDFQGLFAFFQNTALADAKKPAVVEKLTVKKLDYMSVFKKQPRQTAPRLPGGEELEIPVFRKGEEYLEPPDPKTRFPGRPRFSPLALLAEKAPQSEAFRRNIANRLWFVMMGRGLVHPLDLHHSGNPPSHPELLELLAREFAAHRFDIRWLLRELALTRTYQRSSVLPEGSNPVPPESFRVAHEKRLSAEQLLASMLVATGTRLEGQARDSARAAFVQAFANPSREPEDDFNPSLKAALFVLNDRTVLGWLTPKPGNLVDRLAKRSDAEAIEEAYLSVLTRRPTGEEQAELLAYLSRHKGERRVSALAHMAWALLASTEFCLNH